jgi:PatG Domain
MEQPETNETAPIESVEAREASPAVAPARSVAGPVITQGAPGCPTCGGVAGAQNGGTASSSYVYALGQIETRFPRPSVEKEVAQATGRAETVGHTDQQAFHHVLSRRENRYLARQLCWILSIQGLETYILQPRDPADIDLLIGALNNTEPLPWISTVIGVRGPIAPPEFCNGLMIPIVAFDQIYSFSRDALIEAIPRPESIPAERFGPAARELFDRIMQMTDNAGATDEHRALNYLAVRYPNIYARAAEEFAGDFSLTGVEVDLRR